MTPASEQPATPSPRMPFVDSLRLVAAGLVLVQHVADRSAQGWLHAVAALSPGVSGVVLFFLISGFVIPLSVRTGLRPAAFAVRRLARIYPLYLAVLAVVTVGGGLGVLPEWRWVGGAVPATWTANLLLVQDLAGQRAILGVSWTLLIELGWYGLFAGAVLTMGDRAADRLSLILPAGIGALAVASVLLDLRIPLARPGMIYAAALGYQAFRCHAGEIGRRAMWAHGAVFLAVMAAAILISFGLFHHARMTAGQALGPWIAVPVLFLLLVARGEWQASRLLATGLLPRLGAASYSLYLLHPLAISLAFAWLPQAVAAPVAVIAAVVLAGAGYRWIERPGIAFGRWLMRPPVADRADEAGGAARAESADGARAVAGADRVDRTARPARIGWLDSARGIGIVLVVVGHALGGLIDSRLGTGLIAFRGLFFAIYSFHMPLFFLLAGMMVPHRLARDAAGFVRGLGTTVVVPYFVWSALQFSVIHALGAVVNNPAPDYWPTILALPWKTVSQFWFLYVLFWLHLAAAVVVPRWGAAALVAGAVAMKLLGPALDLPVVVRLICGHALFYALGVLLRPDGVHRLVIARSLAVRRLAFPALAVAALVAIFACLPRLAADPAWPGASSPQLANLAWRLPVLPTAMAGVAACLALASLPRLAASPALRALGGQTMPIFLMHVLFVAGARIVLLRLGLVAEPWLLAPLLVVAGIAGPLAAARVLRPLGLRRVLGF